MKGSGPDDAEILIVGQGPGAREDIAGTPFVGKSGKFLDLMLADAGLDRSRLFVTNATRCRPPLIDKKERAPTPEEINACRRYLIEEVQRIKPKAIIALGDAALRALCKTSGISSKRGQPRPLHPDFGFVCDVWPTYHPAFILKKQPLRRTVVADLRKVRDRNLPKDEIEWTWFAHGWGPSVINAQADRIAYDVEAIDHDAKIVEKFTQLSIAVPVHNVGTFTLVSQESTLDEMLESMRTTPAKIISHFGWDYDDHQTGIVSHRDTAALAYLDDETQPLGLESLCVKYLGVRGWKEERDNAKLGTEALATYNARDSLNTLRLHDCLVDVLGSRIAIADEILLPARLALNACSQRGLPISLSAVLARREQFAEAISAARVQCRSIAGEPDLNPGSNQRVGALLVARGSELLVTATGEWAVDKGALQQLTDPLAGAVLDYRHAVKYDSTYGKPYEDAARSEDARMHNLYTLIRTVTGRTSAKRSNVQNLPRDLRDFLTNIVMADYASIEFRLAAWIAQEPTILANYAANRQWDPHRFFGAELYDKPMPLVTADERQISKSGNFSQLFLGTPETLIEYGKKVGVAIDGPTGRKVHLAFREVYPGFVTWWNFVLDVLKTQGYVESATGRRRHFGSWELLSWQDKQDAWREAVNFLVQSLAADLALLGLACCHKAGLPINGFFHDAISFDKAGLAPGAPESIRYCMVEQPLSILRERFGVDITIPIDIEIKESD